jgi:hypothetical protein
VSAASASVNNPTPDNPLKKKYRKRDNFSSIKINKTANKTREEVCLLFVVDVNMAAFNPYLKFLRSFYKTHISV